MAKWTAIAALGEMAKGGGSYFGAVNAQKVKAERLAEARAQKIADDERSHLLALERSDYDKQGQMEVAAYKAELESEARAEEPNEGLKVKYLIDAEDTQDGIPRVVYTDGSTKALDDAAGFTPVSTGAGSGGSRSSGRGGKMTEGDKRLAFRAASGEDYLDTMDALMKGDFDPASYETWFKKQMNKMDVTRQYAGTKVQIWEAASEGITAAVLRTDTGAAAPEPEQIRYVRRLIPSTGDDPKTIEWKKSILRSTFGAMEEASRPGTSQEEIRAAGIRAAMRFEANNAAPNDVPRYQEAESQTVRDVRGRGGPPRMVPAENYSDPEADAYLESLFATDPTY